MNARKNKLIDYRLTYAGPLGLKWQDKREGADGVYIRHFGTPGELMEFLVEYFGRKVMRKVWEESFTVFMQMH